MVHVARRLLGAVVVLAIVAGATLALTSRPRLSSDRSAVEREWRAARPGLDARYRLADALARDIDAAGGPANPLVTQVDDAYSTWRAQGGKAAVADEIATANTLEGLSRRLAVTVTRSTLLHGDHTVTAALTAMNAAPIPQAVTALEDAIAKYEKDRGGALRRLVAGPLGYHAIPRLDLASGS
jgi:hypothetical protein